MEQMNGSTGELIPVLDVETSPDCGKLFDALAKAQAEIKGAAKDAANPHFKSKYADLSSIVEACRAPLTKNGIAVIQVPYSAGGDVGITTIFGHSSGQWVRGRIAVKPMKYDAQGAGSVLTYLRRYALAAMAGVAPEDDDGEGAAGRGNGRDDAPISPPASRPQRTAAPSPVADDPALADARAKAAELKKAINAAPNIFALGSLMKQEATLEKLAQIKAQSATAYETLIDLANSRERTMTEVA